jgi:NAD(P)-dependent dehydrogenase (short-subunit alcohol dehydrogenase family)
MEAWIDECARARPIDLLIANAGVIDRPGRTPQEVIEVNLLGVLNTSSPPSPEWPRAVNWPL